TAAGATGGEREVPRVPRGLHQQVVAHVLVAEGRRVGLAEDDRPGAAKPARRGTVLGGDMVLEELRAEGQPATGDRLQILDRDGDAVQGTELVAPHHLGGG